MTDAEPKQNRSSLGLRWISAAIGIPLLLYLCHSGGRPFSAAILLLSILGLRELMAAYWATGIRPNLILAAMGLIAPAWALMAGPSAISEASVRIYSHVPFWIPVLVLLACCWELIQVAREDEVKVGRGIAYGSLCGVYISLFGGLGYLREGFAHSLARTDPAMELGARLLLLTLLCVWATDSLAFFVGRAIGKRKLAPALSPNKTVEGSFGGLLAALLVGGVCGYLLLKRPVAGVAVGAIAGVFGQIGDLFESALKREIGAKDLGRIIPGHGGVLDRFDSLLFAAPLVALLVPWLL